jgi:DNA-binding XRE family transcriptional regulator
MPKPTATQEKVEDRIFRQQEWRAFRRNFPLTQSELAEELGISRRTVQAVEAGEVTPHPRTLRRFSAVKASFQEGICNIVAI